MLDGNIEMGIKESLRLYNLFKHQFLLSVSKKKDFLVHIFDGTARKCLIENCTAHILFWDKAQLMLREYAREARQMQVKGTLETLPLRSFMREKSFTEVSEG